MLRSFAAFLLLLLAGPRVYSQNPPNQLDGDPTLFAVTAALYAAQEGSQGFQDATAVRDLVKSHLKGREVPSLPLLRQFVASHRRSDPGADYAQYVSLALTSGEAPAFEPRYLGAEVPPDVAGLEGFTALLTRFYREADVEALWQKAQPVLEQELARYHQPVSQAVLEVNSYLRSPTSGYMGRTYRVFLDLLGPPAQIQTRSYGEDYFVVVTPMLEMQTRDIRHAYLHYLLDPLAGKYSAEVNEKRGLIDYAQGAPALGESYKADFLLLATECLIKAVESRLTQGPAAGREGVVQQALAEGFVLTPYFAEALPAYEKGEVAMRLHFPDMVKAIDLRKEAKRLESIEFAAAPSFSKASSPDAPRIVTKVPPAATGARKTLEDADKAYADRNLPTARDLYQRVLEQSDDRALHAQAFYGLARVAALEKNPELAEKLFRKTLEYPADAQTRSWSHVYLGRLSDLAGERDQAAKSYEAALAVEGASPAALQAARQGLQSEFQKKP